MEHQRRTPRFPFCARAEVSRADLVEETSVKELSLYGCYLESTIPLPGGTRVIVKIFAGDEYFEAPATVLYSRPALGTGLGFREVKPTFQAVLRTWLRQALDKHNAASPSIDDFKKDS